MLAADIYQRIDNAARKCAGEHAEMQGSLAGLWKRLEGINGQADIGYRLEQAAHYIGAVPTAEPPGSSFPPVSQTLPCIGVDGSQVYPDERSPVLWAYIQAVAFRQGSTSHPLLFRFWGDQAAPLPEHSAVWLDAERTLLELETACQAAQKWSDHLILLDNPLMSWFDFFRDASFLERYLALLKSCSPRYIAGVVSSPRSTLLADLIRLADCPHPADWKRRADEVNDTALVRRGIPVGFRSALFRYAPGRNRAYQQAEAGVYFFFVRVTTSEVVRVEIPEWLAQFNSTVQLIHASVLADSRMLGYSYALTQAHRQAAVTQDVAEALRRRAERVFLSETQKALPPSGKQVVKALAAQNG